ncbi:hypothetical protein DV711_06585 [Motiliproteus coralliicola]|uniref:Hemerythrin-like domain-containing protein n=1 Tax=Motiliproteus coralliicola TaxID=2283196 RepID=A0A369WXF8_9GAMM|nr:bacteriohemerythrin [Motiliproteus coralliicola]RDE25216.1 hypothetical protein DV711_06585 [Motiliproteus coralliicola]
MIIEWSDELSIGIPEIDVEHKFLVALVNGLHSKILANDSQQSLAETFSHLIRYTEKHFHNEEAVMRAIGFPLLQRHQDQHLDLADHATELSRMYLSGAKSIDLELLEFLKDWIAHHILIEDSKIADYLDGRDLPENWGYTAAFSSESDSCFKICSFCGKTWRNLDEFVADGDKQLLDCMIDQKNHYFNLFLFNCCCGTTLAIPLFDFVKLNPDEFYLEENKGKPNKPGYCLSPEDPCLAKCACHYTSQLLDQLKLPKSD